MASTLKLTFNQNLTENERINVNVNTGVDAINLSEVFKSIRSRSGEATLGANINTTATNYAQAWNLDHANNGGRGNMLASANAGVVTITLNEPSWQFVGALGWADPSAITVEVTNEPVQPAKSIKVDSYASAVDVCNESLVSFSATGADSYNVYVDNTLTLSGVTSPFDLSLSRGMTSVVRAVDSLGTLIGELQVKPPRRLLSKDISTDIINLEGGATVTVNTTFISSDLTPLEYSLDGVTWYESNIFTGQPAGDYTVHVRDAWGCSATKQITVDGVTTLTQTILKISEINPLRFALVEGGKKNFRNTLSFHELKQVKYPFIHKYLEEDSVTTQIKTNAKYLNVYTLDMDGNSLGLTPIKKSENTGLVYKSTATYFDMGGGRSAIYFGVVDLIDPVSGSVTETTDYGFTVPEWAQEGMYVNIDGIGMVKIDKVGYSEFYDSFILEFAISYTGAATEKIITATYNIQPYEVYEFSFAMNTQPEEFHVVVEAGSSAEMIEYTYISEKIKLTQDHEKLYEITYSDSQNRGDMVYATGVVYKLRLEGWSDYLGEQQTEGYNGDQEYFKTDDTVFRSEVFTFPRLSSEMAHKLRLISSHKNLVINKILYKLAEAPEIKTDANNNFKTFVATFKNGGELFLSSDQEIISGGSAETEVISGAVEASRGKSLILWTKQNG